MSHSPLDLGRIGHPQLISSEPLDSTTRSMQPIRKPVGSSSNDAWVAALTAIQYICIRRLVYVTVLKRGIDLVASFILLFALLPVLLLAMIAVRLDSPGPAFFCQDRVGRGGRVFRLYKLRTMTFKPTSDIELVEDENGQLRHKIRNDPRVTRCGRLLRRTSLDELPQLINILKGDMSLIGPRPELVQIVQQYEPWQHERHIVRPGLTGWWQVSGRSDRPMHENTELDLHYVRNQCFRLDLLIAFRTIRVVLRGLGAY